MILNPHGSEELVRNTICAGQKKALSKCDALQYILGLAADDHLWPIQLTYMHHQKRFFLYGVTIAMPFQETRIILSLSYILSNT
jgi:hypothetical protein